MWIHKSEPPKATYVTRTFIPEECLVGKLNNVQKFEAMEQIYGRWEEFGKVKSPLPLFGKMTSPLEYIVWLRVRSFLQLGTISSLIFMGTGIYLTSVGLLPFEIGGPLTMLFGLLTLVFSTKLLHWRKA